MKRPSWIFSCASMTTYIGVHRCLKHLLPRAAFLSGLLHSCLHSQCACHCRVPAWSSSVVRRSSHRAYLRVRNSPRDTSARPSSFATIGTSGWRLQPPAKNFFASSHCWYRRAGLGCIAGWVPLLILLLPPWLFWGCRRPRCPAGRPQLGP